MTKFKIYFITIHPPLFKSYFEFGVFKQVKLDKQISVEVINLRDYATNSHGTIDDKPFGGDDGMVFRIEPLAAALRTLPENCKIIYTTPAGKLWNQSDVSKFQEFKVNSIAFICGRFAGIDQRVIDNYVDLEYRLGDFVCAGGELPAILIAESILREYTGVLGNNSSSKNDSFCSNYQGLLEHPVYTRPAIFEGDSVPEVLLSGNHKKISQWQRNQRREVTKLKRPDLLKD